MDLICCFTCGRMFRDTDATGVCPAGHETRCAADDSDGYGDDYLRKIVG